MKTDYLPPVMIIAAARSGTKMLRAALGQSSDFAEFPYDINYIWKFGNYHIDHDELTKHNLNEKISRFIEKQFDNTLQKDRKGKRVLEKSVSNSLRVDFVKEVFPDCRIIHLFRDGRDVAASARLCWQAPMTSGRIQSRKDLIRKIGDFPVSAASPYLLTYLNTYLARFLSSQKELRTWGPRFKGMDEAVRKYSLLDVCGQQWSHSVISSLKSLSSMRENEHYINVKYEDLVYHPVSELEKIRNFLDIEDFEPVRRYAETRITNSSVGSWQKTASLPEMDNLGPHIADAMNLLGYSDPSERLYSKSGNCDTTGAFTCGSHNKDLRQRPQVHQS